MNYSTLNHQEIEESINKELDFNDNYRGRRNQQIEDAKTKARHQKRIDERDKKRAQEKLQKERNNISNAIMEEKYGEEAELLI